MMPHPAITKQLAAERQRELPDHASRHQQARTAQAARSARQAMAPRTRPCLRSVHAVPSSH
jgi:hypothetical protein